MRLNRDWRSGASLRLRKGLLILMCDYDPELIEALKAAIPSRHRQWVPKYKAWVVTRQYERLVIRLVRECLGEIIRTER